MKGNKSGSSSKKKNSELSPAQLLLIFLLCISLNTMFNILIYFVITLINSCQLFVCMRRCICSLYFSLEICYDCLCVVSLRFIVHICLCVVRRVDDVNSHNYGWIVLAAYAIADAKRDTEFVRI